MSARRSEAGRLETGDRILRIANLRKMQAGNTEDGFSDRWSYTGNQSGKSIVGMSAKIDRFEDLQVWKESMQLAVRIYQVMEQTRDFGLKGQMQRAAVSIPSNIAEGYERGSNKEFVQFLYYSQGSSGELRTQLYLAGKLGFLDQTVSRELLEKSRKVSAMLHKFIRVRKRDF